MDDANRWAYWDRLAQPSWRKVKITLLFSWVLPFPIYYCFEQSCDWTLMWVINLVLPGFDVLIFTPGAWLLMLGQFLIYAGVVYAAVNGFVKT